LRCLSNNFSAFLDRDLLGGGTALASDQFNLVDNVKSISDLSKDNVLSVQPRSVNGANEKLTSVGTGARVGHAQDSSALVLEVKVFVIKLVSVDALSAGTVVVGEITTLAHELGDDAMEAASLVSKSLFSGAQGTEVLGRLGDGIGKELKLNATNIFVSDSHVKVDYGIQ
jgi:hypothetical protein